MSVRDFGAFIEIAPGTDGMCHISELKDGYVEKVTDVVNVGDEVTVKVILVDDGAVSNSAASRPCLPRSAAATTAMASDEIAVPAARVAAKAVVGTVVAVVAIGTVIATATVTVMETATAIVKAARVRVTAGPSTRATAARPRWSKPSGNRS